MRRRRAASIQVLRGAGLTRSGEVLAPASPHRGRPPRSSSQLPGGRRGSVPAPPRGLGFAISPLSVDDGPAGGRGRADGPSQWSPNRTCPCEAFRCPQDRFDPRFHPDVRASPRSRILGHRSPGVARRGTGSEIPCPCEAFRCPQKPRSRGRASPSPPRSEIGAPEGISCDRGIGSSRRSPSEASSTAVWPSMLPRDDLMGRSPLRPGSGGVLRWRFSSCEPRSPFLGGGWTGRGLNGDAFLETTERGSSKPACEESSQSLLRGFPSSI